MHRHLLRILLNAATAVSLLLCVATIALWVRSQTLTDVIAYGDLLEHRNAGEIKFRETSIVAFRDAVALRQTVWTQTRTPHRGVVENDRADALERGRIMQAVGGWRHVREPAAALPVTPARAVLPVFHAEVIPPRESFAFIVGQTYVGSWPYTSLRAVPWWAVTMAFALAPVFAAPRWLRAAKLWCQARRRARAGLCLTCGYDLRATPTRCPECGTPAAPSP